VIVVSDLALDLTMRQFILGQLDPSARLRLEERLVTDPAAAQALALVEQDVSEDYLDDALTPLERQGFEVTVLATAAGRQHFDAIQAIREADRVRSRKTAPAPLSFAERVRRSFLWEPVMAGAVAAVALVACAASVALLIERQRLLNASAGVEQQLAAARESQAAGKAAGPAQSGEPTGVPAPSVIAVAPTAGTPNLALSGPPQRQAVGPTSLVALALQPGSFRGNGSGLRRVVVPEGTIAIRLLLDAPDATAPAYRADLMNSDGERLMSLERVAVIVRGSARQVTLDVPASIVPPGDYQVELLDSASGARLPRYSFRVRGR
jgi:anti-sigma factor RsiW